MATRFAVWGQIIGAAGWPAAACTQDRTASPSRLPHSNRHQPPNNVSTPSDACLRCAFHGAAIFNG